MFLKNRVFVNHLCGGGIRNNIHVLLYLYRSTLFVPESIIYLAPVTFRKQFNKSCTVCTFLGNSTKPIVPWWHHIVAYIWADIDWFSGLLPDGTKALPGPMLTYHQQGSVALVQNQFHTICSIYWFVNEFENVHLRNYLHISQEPLD